MTTIATTGAGGGAPAASVYVNDTFTGTAGVKLTSHPPEVGGSWVNYNSNDWALDGSGNATIGGVAADDWATNGVVNQATGSGGSYTVTVVVTIVTYPAIIVRSQNAANHHKVAFRQDTGNIEVYAVTAGTPTLVATFAGGTAGGGVFTVAVTNNPATGDIACYVGGVLKGTYTNATRATQEGVGIGQFGSGANLFSSFLCAP